MNYETYLIYIISRTKIFATKPQFFNLKLFLVKTQISRRTSNMTCVFLISNNLKQSQASRSLFSFHQREVGGPLTELPHRGAFPNSHTEGIAQTSTTKRETQRQTRLHFKNEKLIPFAAFVIKSLTFLSASL